MSTGEWADRVALVTGGAGGMGRAIVEAFTSQGTAVVVADVDDARGTETVDAAQAAGREAGGEAFFVRADVSAAGDVAGLIETATARFGRLDYAVNAAAVEFESAPLHQCADEDFDRMLAINVRSVFLCMKHELQVMLERGHGAIVNIASTSSYRPQPETPAYTASKHAVLGLTRAAAADYARSGIRINAIAPGAIDTAMLREALARRRGDEATAVRALSPMGRFGHPEEIARAALWLCSDDASFTTGHVLAVDGGFLAR